MAKQGHITMAQARKLERLIGQLEMLQFEIKDKIDSNSNYQIGVAKKQLIEVADRIQPQ